MGQRYNPENACNVYINSHFLKNEPNFKKRQYINVAVFSINVSIAHRRHSRRWLTVCCINRSGITILSFRMRVSARCDRCQCRTAACFFHLPRHHFGVHPFLTCIPSVRRHTLRVALIVPFSEKSTSINQLLCFRDFLCLLAAISPQ